MVTQPVRQFGTVLLAAIGTNTWLVPEKAATECADPAGCGFVSGATTAGTLSVGTRCSRVWLNASITSRVAAPWAVSTGAVVAVPNGGRAGVIAFGARLLPPEVLPEAA